MIYLATPKDINKAESEDAVLIGNEVICDAVGAYAIPRAGFICVADGVGGHNGGRTASHYVLDALSESNPMPDHLRNTVLQINTDLLKESDANRDLSEMATILSGIYLLENVLQSCILEIHESMQRRVII